LEEDLLELLGRARLDEPSAARPGHVEEKPDAAEVLAPIPAKARLAARRPHVGHRIILLS
jgi:hypothetical protein